MVNRDNFFRSNFTPVLLLQLLYYYGSIMNKTSNDTSDSSLQRELNQLQSINDVIGSTIKAVQAASSQVECLRKSTSNSQQLIQIWSSLVSQNKHVSDMMSSTDKQGWQRSDQLNEILKQKQKQLKMLKDRQAQLERLQSKQR